jgi:hypothetical protein
METTEIDKREHIKLLQRTRGDFHSVVISQHEKDFKKQAQAFLKRVERMDKSVLVLSAVCFD